MIGDGSVDTVLVGLRRQPGPAGRQAGHGPVLPRHRGQRLDRGVQLPARRRRRDEPAARVPGVQLGAGLRRLLGRARPDARCGSCRGSSGPRSCCATWSRSTTRRRRSRCRPAPSSSARWSGPPSSGFLVNIGAELEFFLFKDSYAEAAQKRYHGLVPHSDVVEDYHILQTTRDEYVIRDIRNGLQAAGVPGRVLQGRGRQGPARDQPALRRGRRDGRPQHHLQERRQGDRRPARPVAHLHGQVRHGRGRLVLPHPLQPVGPEGQEVPDVGRQASPTT